MMMMMGGFRWCTGLVPCTRDNSSAPTRVPRRPPLLRGPSNGSTTTIAKGLAVAFVLRYRRAKLMRGDTRDLKRRLLVVAFGSALRYCRWWIYHDILSVVLWWTKDFDWMKSDVPRRRTKRVNEFVKNFKDFSRLF